MAGNVVILEEQRFNQKWIYIILFSILAISIVIGIAVFINKEEHYLLSMLPVALMIALIVLFKRMTLSMRINDQLLAYRFKPFQLRYKTIDKGAVDSLSVISYNPIADYGGWGIRVGAKGWAYTTSGSYGISIRLKNKKHVLIGTNKPEDISAFLQQYWPEQYMA
jgi:hypothetical protein